MTSDYIRSLKIKLVGENCPEAQTERSKIIFLQEIAAQLAELNEHFRKADESVFGVKDNAKK